MSYIEGRSGVVRLYNWLREALDLLGIGGMAITDTLQVLEVLSAFCYTQAGGKEDRLGIW